MPERDVSFFTVKGGESWKRIFTRTCSCHVLLDSIREFAVHELSSLLSAAQQDIRDELNRLEAEEEERQRLEEERLVLEAIENENQLLHALEKNEEEKEKEEEEKRRLEEEKMKEKEKETITSTSRRGMSRRKMNKSSSKSDVQTKREKEKAQKEQELKEKREREEKEAREKAAAEHKESLIQAEKKISQELIEVSAIEGVDLFDSEGTPMNLRTLGEAYASTRIKGNGVYILVVVKGGADGQVEQAPLELSI